MSIFDLDAYLSEWRPRIDSTLSAILDEACREPDCPEKLGAAMRHALLGGGKRLRPLLCLAATRASGGDESDALRVACALELIHAYSLVHDDLPAMDDDDFRRGKPSCHRAFGEGLAILAGDALLTHAFRIIADGIDADRVADAVRLVSRACGPLGMVGGQANDILETGREPGVEEVEFNHQRKTGALFTASVELGGLVAGAARDVSVALSGFGSNLGLAFQIADDLLGMKGDPDCPGRPAGADEAMGRRTHPRAVGPGESIKRAQQLVARAQEAIRPLGERADVLLALADLIGKRARDGA